MKFSILCLFLSLLCATPAICGAVLRLDPDLVRAWNKNDKAAFPTPLAAVFTKEGRTLIFVGDHHADPAATYKLVEASVKKFKPGLIVVEGLDFAAGENPADHMKKFGNKSKEEIWKDPSLGCGAEQLAIANKIPIIGGEPTIQEQMKNPYLLAQGFSAEDILNVQILQRIPYRRDRLKMANADDFFAFAMKLYDVAAPKEEFKAKFLAWYKKHSQTDFTYTSITQDTAAVNCKTDDSFFQRVACEFNRGRDRALIEHMNTLLASHQTLLVVYGTGHFVQEYPALVKAFGAGPDYLK